MATQSDSGIDQVKSADAAGAEKATPPNLSKEEKKTPADAAEKGTPPKLSKEEKRAAAAPVANQAAPQDGADQSEAREEESHSGSRFLLTNAVPSWMVSLILHTILLMVLGFMGFSMEPDKKNVIMASTESEDMEEVDEQLTDEPDIEPLEVNEVEMDVVPQVITEEETNEVEPIDVADDVEAPPAQISLEEFADKAAPKTDLLSKTSNVTGSGFEGRGEAAKGQMVAKFGGSKGSEAAVAMALEWLAEHQNPDGSWSFDHTLGKCQGRCADKGTLATSRNGATAMALLPFLGAGQTHKEGKYKKNVEMGLYFLGRSMKMSPKGGMLTGDLTDSGGRMYSHGLCAITLCEAYGMTQDKALRGPAQASLNFIMYAQDPVGGGWRYSPRQAGDTSVVGWQLMALKSGHLAYLQVNPLTIKGTFRYLDAVQANSGATYGYTTPGAGNATTAIGLLCRMYLGWKKDEPALQRGVERLSGIGPSSNNMYYNYYATQVMRHHGGDHWEKWNKKMRDQLVNSQSKEGHMKGSWYMNGGHSRGGGRLYNTSMATMVLEVYYRHMPIYGKQAAEEDFPL